MKTEYKRTAIIATLRKLSKLKDLLKSDKKSLLSAENISAAGNVISARKAGNETILWYDNLYWFIFFYFQDERGSLLIGACYPEKFSDKVPSSLSDTFRCLSQIARNIVYSINAAYLYEVYCAYRGYSYREIPGGSSDITASLAAYILIKLFLQDNRYLRLDTDHYW